MKKSNASNIAVAMFLALGVAGIVYFLQSKPASIVEDKNRNLVQILVSKVDLLPGERVDVNKFDWVDWPSQSMNDEYYKKGAIKAIEELKGKVIRYRVVRGEPLKRSDLIGGSNESILGAFISPGMKAVSVPLRKVANADVYFAPGDFVDIILPQQSGRVSSVDTILSGIKVIAVDNNFYVPEGEQSNKIAKNITLEVSSEQAEALALSIAKGQIVISYHSALTPKNERNQQKTIKKVQKVKISRGDF